MNHLPPFQSFDTAFDFLTEYMGIHLDIAKKLLERGLLITAYQNKSYVLCSKTAFTEEVRQFAQENEIMLVTLKDLYQVP